MARPSKFQSAFCKQAEKLCKLGATDKQLADFFGVSEKTLNNWKQQHPEFLQSLKDGKELADSAVEESLFHRAMGYTHPEEKIFCQGEIVTKVDTTKHYPPDTTAAIFWLKNRRPDRWRDVKAVEMSGSIEHRHVDELTDDELFRIATGRSEGATEKAGGEKEPSSVH